MVVRTNGVRTVCVRFTVPRNLVGISMYIDDDTGNLHWVREGISSVKTRYNEANKFGWKSYCSLRCLGDFRKNRKRFVCSNPDCEKVFERCLSDLVKSEKLYCSRSCATTVNNRKFPKKVKVWGNCAVCGKQCDADQKYCSRKCKAKEQVVGKEGIIKQISQFYDLNGRIPLKREFRHYRAAFYRFGTWNKAITAAGFEPHLVMFAKKYVANDGHKCDSLAEKIIDDWLFARKIPHNIHVPYGVDRMTADFEVNGTLIEFLGLTGQLSSYDSLVRRKRALWKKLNLEVIQIFPGDLFPTNKLRQMLKSVST